MSFTRALIALSTLALAASCTHVRAPLALEAGAPPIRDQSYAAEKREMIYQIDRRMNALVSTYTAEIETIRGDLVRELERVAPPARLVAVDRALRGYGAAQEERYAAAIQRLVDEAVAKTVALVGQEARLGQDAVVGKVTLEAWDIARSVGLGQRGAGYGFESGVREIDERAAVTIELLQGAADIEGLKALGAIRRAEVLALSSAYSHDITLEELAVAAPSMVAAVEKDGAERPATVGRLLLFRTGEIESWRTARQDAEGVVIAFRNDHLPVDHRFGLMQITRQRIVRGGMIVKDFGWMLDPQVPGGRGRVRLSDTLADPRFLASECVYPGLNVDHTMFDRLHDFQVIYDFKTSLVDETAGQVLGALSWQLTWVISHNGQVRHLDPVGTTYDADTSIYANLMRDGGGLTGGGEPSPSDLLNWREAASAPAVVAIERDLGGGVRGVVAESVGDDRLRITPAGRRYLLANQLHLIAGDVRWFSYMDGRHGRDVLAMTEIAAGSAIADLGFLRNDAIHNVNGVPVHKFIDLWNYVAEHPDEPEYKVLINRNGALRWITFEVPAAPTGAPPIPEEDLDAELVDRLNDLFNE